LTQVEASSMTQLAASQPEASFTPLNALTPLAASARR
jgi:hypothetical protein